MKIWNLDHQQPMDVDLDNFQASIAEENGIYYSMTTSRKWVIITLDGNFPGFVCYCLLLKALVADGVGTYA